MSTKPSEWKRKAERTKTVKLPSGNEVKVRRPSLLNLMRRGIVPKHLYQVAMNAMDGKDPGTMKAEDMKPFVEFMAVFVIAAVVEPTIVMNDKPKENEISIGLLTDEDQFKIFIECQAKEAGEGSETLEPFREKHESPASGRDGEKVRPEAEPAPGNK